MRSIDREEFELSRRRLIEENASLRMRLDEAEETLRAIRHGEVDALVVSGPGGEQLDQGNKQSARAEITLVSGDSTSFPTYLTLSALPADVEGCICMIVTDLTEQDSMRRNQATIEALNARLRRAMTETHHRVKNS